MWTEVNRVTAKLKNSKIICLWNIIHFYIEIQQQHSWNISISSHNKENCFKQNLYLLSTKVASVFSNVKIRKYRYTCTNVGCKSKTLSEKEMLKSSTNTWNVCTVTKYLPPLTNREVCYRCSCVFKENVLRRKMKREVETHGGTEVSTQWKVVGSIPAGPFWVLLRLLPTVLKPRTWGQPDTLSRARVRVRVWMPFYASLQ